MFADPPVPSTAAGWQTWLMLHWGRVDGMLIQAKRSGFIPFDLTTWDSTDMIDIEYYVCDSFPPVISFCLTCVLARREPL